MANFQLNAEMKISSIIMGNEQIPLLVIDNLFINPEQLINVACSSESKEHHFQQQSSDHYPGIRKVAPPNYHNQLSQLFSLFKATFAITSASQADIIMSAFSITTTPEAQLRPIQMLPHFDSPVDNQLAMVHYLCDHQHGGTSWYRHKLSGFERITTTRHAAYRQQIKQQAIAEKLHEKPKYIEGDTDLFTQIHTVEAKMNRAVIYPSNALHSGNIRPELGLMSDPQQGRLTISSFISIR